MTRSATAIAVLLAAAGTAAAQDSVAATFSSDALSPYLADAQQGANYVVDLTPFTTSWGTEFGIAPILKTTQTDILFNNNLGSAQSLARSSQLGVTTAGGNFMVWNSVGGGINAAKGQTSTLVNPPATVNRTAAGIMDFNLEYDGIIGGAIEYDPAAPGRLYISRRHIASTLNNALDAGESSLGGLTVSNDGNFFYRGDGFGPTGLDKLTGSNIYRTNLASRGAGTNLISNSGLGMDSTARIVTNSFTTISVPNFVPGTTTFASPTFSSQYTYGSTTATSAAPLLHMDATKVQDHRGAISSTSRFTLDPAGVATFSIIGRDGTFLPTTNYANINIWSVDATGAIVGTPSNFTFPQVMVDNDATAAGFSYDRLAGGILDNPASFRSQTAFQGGVGQAPIGMDQQGRALAALYYTDAGAQNNPDNTMVAVRFDPNAVDPTLTAEYGVVAYTFFDLLTATATGKPITDGMGNVIGQLIPLDSVTNGIPFGPSFSSPAIDSVGNMWFQSSVELFNRFPDINGNLTVSDFDSALIRAVYDPTNPAGPAWQLDLVLELGTTILGSDSGVNWRINFMGTADSNSISSGTMSSTNVAEDSYNGFDVSALPTSDSRNTGGVVVNASIVYDVDGDGDYNTDPLLDPTTLDQDYNTLLYIGNLNPANPVVDPCLAIDFNGDTILDNGDIGAFVGLFLTGNIAADLNGDGILDNGDIGTFVNLFLSCVG